MKRCTQKCLLSTSCLLLQWFADTLSDLCSTRRRDEDSGSARSKLCGRGGALAWLTQTQLCPIIWAIVIGLLVLFVFKASQQAADSTAAGLRRQLCFTEDVSVSYRRFQHCRGDIVQVVWNPGLQPAVLPLRLGGLLCVTSASAGLWLLYLVTTTDPGFISRGQRSDLPGSKGAKRQASAKGDAAQQYRWAAQPHINVQC